VRPLPQVLPHGTARPADGQWARVRTAAERRSSSALATAAVSRPALVKGKTKLGADASVAGGPVGRTAEGATGALMQAETLTYSRSRGAFAGLSLEGQVIKHDGTANENLYGKKLEAKEILFGGLGVPSGGDALDAALAKYSPRGGQPLKR